MSFWEEVKRRKVARVAVVYAVVAWLLVQIIVTVEAPLNLPGWIDTFVIILVAVGFPLALVLSWAYDLTPAGIERTKHLESADEMSRQSNAAVSQEAEYPVDTLPNSVAVLPFENLSPNPENAFFASGIHEEILNHLAKIKDLNVIARTSVMQYAGAARHIAEIANELRVSAVMEGSVRYAGDRVRVTAQLIEGATGTHLWTEAYERDLADIFAIQSDIAAQIAYALDLHLKPEEVASLEQHAISDLRAYECYLKSRYEYSKFTTEGAERAIHFLTKGLEYDADNELLNIALGYAYFNYGSAALGADAHDEYLGKAEECARRVLAAKPNSPDGNGLLGLTLYDRFETAKGLQLLRKGVNAPNRNLDTLTWAAFVHSMCGLTKIASAWVDELDRVDPLHGFSQWTIALHRIMEGDFDGAEYYLRRANELESNAPMFRGALGLVLIYLGREDDARGILQPGQVEEPRREVWHIVGRILHHILCEERKAALLLLDEDLENDAKTDMLYSWLLADCYAMLGDLEASVDWLGNAVDGGFLNYPFFRHMDPLLSSLQGREDFDVLMTRTRDRWRSIDQSAGATD